MEIDQIASSFLSQPGVELSTMMKSPCLRYKGDFVAMVFKKEDTLIVKLSPDRVNELIASGIGREFKFTKKRFKEWVLIDQTYSHEYELLIEESLAFLKSMKSG